MDFQDFERAAREAFEMIPPEYREGIDGLDVSRMTMPHPEYPDVFTLGECLTEEYPSEFGVGEVRSIVVLYHGSFLELSRLDEAWDWDHEIFETVTHEVRHHLESLAAEDSLEAYDYAQEQNFARRYSWMTGTDPDQHPASRQIRHPPESLGGEDELEEPDYAGDQNFARREGEPFEPLFFRDGLPVADNAWEVDGDLFVEVPVGEEEVRREEVAVQLPEGPRRLPLPAPLGDVHYVRLPPRGEGESETFAVLVRRRGWREWLAGVLRSRPLDVRSSDAPADSP